MQTFETIKKMNGASSNCVTNRDVEAVDSSAASALPLRFHKNVVVLLVAIPPTYFEAAVTANRFRFRFQNPDCQCRNYNSYRTGKLLSLWTNCCYFLNPLQWGSTGHRVSHNDFRVTPSACLLLHACAAHTSHLLACKREHPHAFTP